MVLAETGWPECDGLLAHDNQCSCDLFDVLDAGAIVPQENFLSA